MKNASPCKKYSNHSKGHPAHKSQSSLPTLNLPKRESVSREKKIKLKQDDKYSINSNAIIQQLIFNPNKDSKIKLKSVKIISPSISITKNPKKAIESLNAKRSNKKIFLKQSPFIIQHNYNANKPKTTDQVIFRGLTSSSMNLALPATQNKSKAVKNNSKKRFKLKTDSLLSELITKAIKGIRNNANTLNNSPALSKGLKKKCASLSMSNSSIKYADTDSQQQQQQEIIGIKEYSYKENPNLNQRKVMEDFHYINQNVVLYNNEHISLFAIFDGHNGSRTAIYCQQNIETHLKQFLKETKLKIEDSLNKAFIELDEEIKKAKPDITKSGTTGTVVVFYNNHIYCANVGDSSCFIFQQDKSIKMTQDHNLKDTAEVKRIKERGGLVFNERVFGTLNLTRVLGDIEMKEYGVIPSPSINTKALTDKDKYVILASDGVWNYYNENKILALIKKYTDISATDLSDKIVSLSLENGSLDNISCIVIKL